MHCARFLCDWFLPRQMVCDTGTIKNLGSFATRDLEAGEFLAEYCGEIISNKEVRRDSSAGLWLESKPCIARAFSVTGFYRDR